MTRSLPWVLLLGAALFCAASTEARAQTFEVGDSLLSIVMPTADRFGGKEGRPPVVSAYRTDPATGDDELIGYVFTTPDVPPERLGYSGPVQAIVGMDLEGTITGVRVLDYYESYRSQMGDFLRRPGHQEQYAGKAIGDPFLVRDDIDGISRATVSSRALARGVRDASRRVARAYLDRAPPAEGLPVPATLSWLELLDRDVVQQVVVHEGDDVLAEVSLLHVDGPATGEHLVGREALGMIGRAVESRGTEGHVMVYGVDGPDTGAFSRQGWAVVQGSDTFPIPERNVFSFGLAGGGLLEVEMATSGAMLLPASVDLDRPFTLALDLGPEREVVAAEYRTLRARAAQAEVATAQGPSDSAPEPDAQAAGEDPTTGPPTATATGGAPPADGPDSARSALSGAPDPDAATADSPVVDPEVSGADSALGESGRPVAESAMVERGRSLTEPAARERGDVAAPAPAAPRFDVPAADESLAEDVFEGISWPRTGGMAALLLLASAAFVRKREGLRWVTLAVTLGYLGFVDGGFLSVSHITSAIWVGGSAFLNDVPLLLLAGFTVVTTLVFGRVFCGFLCPFGALQDLLTRIVPRGWTRRVPGAVHRRALWLKYGVLAIIVVPAAMGIHTSIYPYFEPFGTVFFLSPSLLLWAIAAVFIGAAMIVPRFYCRYACPLGAALAIGSWIAPRRIARVEHCGHCRVCENACPTGAIRGAEIDFPECVRCNACETLLIEKAGVCRHDLAEVRSRLVQIRTSGTTVR